MTLRARGVKAAALASLCLTSCTAVCISGCASNRPRVLPTSEKRGAKVAQDSATNTRAARPRIDTSMPTNSPPSGSALSDALVEAEEVLDSAALPPEPENPEPTLGEPELEIDEPVEAPSAPSVARESSTLDAHPAPAAREATAAEDPPAPEANVAAQGSPSTTPASTSPTGEARALIARTDGDRPKPASAPSSDDRPNSPRVDTTKRAAAEKPPAKQPPSKPPAPGATRTEANTAPAPAPQTPQDPALEAAIALHYRGFQGEDEAAEDALEQLIRLEKAKPDDPRTVAYLGSARVLAATRMFAPWSKGKTCKTGLALLDRALELAPDDLEIRFVRAISTRPLPGFFGRADESCEDFAAVAKRLEAAVTTRELTPEVAALALLHHGECLAASDDVRGSRSAWRRSIQLAPGEPSAKLAREKLDD